MHTNNPKNNQGFIQIIVVVIVIIVVSSFFGFDPTNVWTNMILPFLNFVWDLFIKVTTFLVELVIEKLPELLS